MLNTLHCLTHSETALCFPHALSGSLSSAATLKHFLRSIPELSNAAAVFVMINLTTANINTWYCRS